MTPAELLARYNDPAVQAELDAIETEDARRLIKQIAESNTGLEALAITKRWLRKHWSQGWAAAGGPSGAPETPSKKKSKKAGHS